jgi:hypothetical protein
MIGFSDLQQSHITAVVCSPQRKQGFGANGIIPLLALRAAISNFGVERLIS